MLKPNFTQIPNIILDSMAILSPAEFKVIMYICRRTYGFQKSTDKISLSQLTEGLRKKDGELIDTGTGLSKQGVINAIERLIELEIIIAKKNYKKTTEYSMKYTHSQLSGQAKDYKLVNSVDNTSQLSRKEVVNSVDTQKKEKESIQKKVTEQSSEVFSFEEEIRKNDENNNRALQVIGLFMKLRKDTLSKNITNKETYKVFLKRNMITAHSLKHFTDEQLVRASKKVKRDYSDIDWGLETILKTLIK